MKARLATAALVAALSAPAVAMDDFIHGEPVAIAAVPEPASLFLFGAGILLIASRYRRR